MATRELPAGRSLWEKHERLLLDVFAFALENLRSRKDLPKRENEISIHLAVEARRAAFELGLEHPPQHELPRQPVSEKELGGLGTRKRPDFTYEIRDPAAASSINSWLYYHIECKCLGEPSSKAWTLNKNYVDKGVRRFLDPEHGYGERASSGAMIGYVLSMSFDPILGEVNRHLGVLSELGSAAPIYFSEVGRDQTARASQVLDRLRVLPRDFVLRHLWIDLRSSLAS